MKVIGFVSSPEKNGNTYKLISKALDIAKSKGNEVELITINDKTISGCQACNYCKKHERCYIDDDFQKIYDTIKESDRFLFSSPIYFFDINAQAKLIEDRLYSFIDSNYKTKLANGKKCAFIYSQANPDIKLFESNLTKHEMALNMIGITPVGKLISSGQISESSDDLKNIDNLVNILLE